MRKNLNLLTLFFLTSIIFVNAQEPEPTTTPVPVKKTNQRPQENGPAEPFDKADVKTMAEKCVRLETEAGNIELEMFPESAPETVRNFLNLTASGFYDTTTFSRVVPDFVIQGGSFSTRAERTAAFLERAKRRLKDEPNLIKHERGIASMARGDEPNTAATSFFILVGAGPHLDNKFAAFGRVISGLEVVDAINKMPVNEEKPEKPVRLIKATIIPCPAKTEQ
jgi:peptidyl-prolyl cis-trans isomerase B (cyclophilin B)